MTAETEKPARAAAPKRPEKAASAAAPKRPEKAASAAAPKRPEKAASAATPKRPEKTASAAAPKRPERAARAAAPKRPGLVRQGLSKLRRFWLVKARPGYVRRQLELREGECARCGLCCRIMFRCPHFDGEGCDNYENRYEQCRAFPIDSRDTDLIREMGGECGFRFKRRAEPLIRLSPYGVKVVLFCLAVCGLLATAAAPFLGWWALLFLAPALLVVYFFRDPRRTYDGGDPGAVLSPADGRVVSVSEAEMPGTGEPAVMVDIFLSLFNVHVNRSPVEGRVVETRYEKGTFLNAARRAAGESNENNLILIERPSGSRLAVKQIAGVIARRIVCSAAPGERVEAGERLGMIKFGSRTRLYVPAGGDFEVAVEPGQSVRAGKSPLGRFR